MKASNTVNSYYNPNNFFFQSAATTTPLHLESSSSSSSPESPSSVRKFPVKGILELTSSMKYLCRTPSSSAITAAKAATQGSETETTTLSEPTPWWSPLDTRKQFAKETQAKAVARSDITQEKSPFSALSYSSTTKNVRFSPLVRVKDTLSHRDMNPKEVCDYWIQGFEFDMIRERNLETIQQIEEELRGQQQQESRQSRSQKLQNRDNRNEEELCIRGLEAGLWKESLRRRSLRFEALEEVFLEQEAQYFSGLYDDDALARVYFEVTSECRFWAELKALQDRREIEDYCAI